MAEAPEELIKRIEPDLLSTDDGVCDGALFELYLWKIFSSLDPAPLMEIAPRLPGGSSPDFKLQFPELKPLFVEATVYWMRAKDSRTHQKYFNLFNQVSPYIRVPGYCIGVHQIREGSNSPSPKRLAQRIDNYLSKIDRNELVRRLRTENQLHVTESFAGSIEDPKSGWSIRVTPIPLRDPSQIPVRIAGSIGATPVYCRTPGSDLRETIREKRKQHRKDDPRLLVAACCQDWPGDPGDPEVADVLYGSLTEWYMYPEGDPKRVQRAEDGLWTKPSGQAQNVVGVVTSSLCKPWTVPNDHLSLWLPAGLTIDAVIPAWPFHSICNPPDSDALCETTGKRVTDWLGDEGSHEPGDKHRFLKPDDRIA